MLRSIFMKNNKKSVVPHSFFAKGPVFFLCTAALILFDFYTLNDFFSTYVTSSAKGQYLAVLSIIIMLDGGAILLGHFVCNRLRNQVVERIASISLIILILTAIGLGACMRLSDTTLMFEDYDSAESVVNYFDEGEATEIVSEELSPERANLYFFTQILFCITPVFTSAISFCLSVLRSQYTFLLGIEKLEKHVADLQEQALTIQNSELVNEFNRTSTEASEAQLASVCAKIDSMNQTLKAKVRQLHINASHDIQEIHLAENQAITPPPLFSGGFKSAFANNPTPSFTSATGSSPDTSTAPPISPIFEEDF